jgi:hypothetical protein
MQNAGKPWIEKTKLRISPCMFYGGEAICRVEKKLNGLALSTELQVMNACENSR